MAKTKSDISRDPPPLISELYDASVSKDRATLAKLRRGLGKSFGEAGAAERDAWVIARLRENATDPEIEWACLVASLFAFHPLTTAHRSFGAAFRRLADKNPESEGPERRFVALLDSNPADLPARLRQAVSLLKANDKANEIGIDWHLLLRHLRLWADPNRPVQRRWAKDFWSHRTSSNRDTEN